MSVNGISQKPASRFIYRTETVPAVLLQHFEAIRALADSEKEALGFLPEVAYRDAIMQKRLRVMLARENGTSQLAGFILFSGVFPNARIQAVAVSPEHRRSGVASALVSGLVSHLESRGYIAITAAVASDLATAQAFYESRGFIARHVRDGGQARQRRIVLRSRELDTANFFTLMAPPTVSGQDVVHLGLRPRSAFEAPLYLIDLNVLFDLVKERARSATANRLFGAALAHLVRLAVAPEFIIELERTSKDPVNDTLLKLARQLPKLPAFPKEDVEPLAAAIHKAVFVDTNHAQAGTRQALSDARHLAEAALIRASGYITSDNALLNARDDLLKLIGVDIAGLDEFVELLPAEEPIRERGQLKGTKCETKTATAAEAKAYLSSQNVADALVADYLPSAAAFQRASRHGIFEDEDLVAVGIYRAPSSVDAPARLLVHVRPDHISCETFAEHLLDEAIRQSCHSGPVTIELRSIPGQSTVNRAAKLRGFLPAANSDILIKVALGRPLTPSTWTAIARQTRRRTGLALPEAVPATSAVQTGLSVRGADGSDITVQLAALEAALAPTLIVWPGRDGVIVPIAKSFADDLLGTADQLYMFGRPNAAFVSLRTYFNSPRTAPLMRSGVPILFYESKRSGGRAAIVAAGRIVDATIVSKERVSDELLQRAVVEDLEPLTTSSDVLATSFDSLIRFPNPVTLDTLRQLGAEGSSNLQTTTPLPNAQLAAILDRGWLSV
ncbi:MULTISPECIES: GNAT family N-acetyltransferase [unclassified Bradyrhizobium]|uniref:GNAT family N-acetyltransferase n=1 Tax=unclassified Bradyrhizobium TaxID=2631580 RepID=UPI0029162326|nr:MULTISPECIES: GNAT family N-acetyltransferase [unclassified Bradyrhizobium]